MANFTFLLAEELLILIETPMNQCSEPHYTHKLDDSSPEMDDLLLVACSFVHVPELMNKLNFAQPTRLEGTLITLRDEIKHTVKISCFNQ